MKGRLRSQNFPTARLLSITLLVAVVLTMVIGAPKPASPAPVAKEPIKICILTPLSGPFAGTGRAQLMGAELAAALINEKGGILGRPVKIVGRDDEVKPATAIKHAREVRTSEGVNFFAGIISSGVALALGPVMQELDSVLVISAAASTKITGINFNKHVFRVSPSTGERRFAFAGLVHSKYPEIKKLANISPDYEYGHSSWNNFIYKLKQLNPQVEVVASRWPPFGAAGGYGPHITAIMEAKPDAVYCTLFAGDLIAFYREAKEFGLFDRIKLFVNGHTDWDVTYTLGSKIARTTTAEHYADFVFNHPISEEYEKEFKAKYGADQFKMYQGHAAPTFNSIFLYKKAIEAAGSTKTQDVIKAIENVGWWDTNHGREFMRAGDHQNYVDHAWFEIIPDPTRPEGFRIGESGHLKMYDFMLPEKEALNWDNTLSAWIKAHPEVKGK